MICNNYVKLIRFKETQDLTGRFGLSFVYSTKSLIL